MRILQKIYSCQESFNITCFRSDFEDFKNDSLFFIFINKERNFWRNQLKNFATDFSNSLFIGATTAGQIADDFIYDSECVITALKFSKAKYSLKSFESLSPESSFDTGKLLAEYGNSIRSKAALIISEGLNINGSRLVEGINSINQKTIFSGGLSGDGPDFKETMIFFNGEFKPNSLAAIFFDENIEFSTASAGGWTSFGVERTVTKSEANVVYEIDGLPALNLYKDYLGQKVKLLPSYGLHFPICLSPAIENHGTGLVRTLLGIDEKSSSLTFAGDVSTGTEIKLMKSSTKELLRAAQELYASEIDKLKNVDGNVLSLIISCVGRRLVMGQNTEEEFSLPQTKKSIIRSGFYSYGEISTDSLSNNCSLHNQTFTLTLIWEKLHE